MNAGVTVAVGNAAAALALVVLGVGLGEKAGAAAESDICERRDRRRSKRKKRTDRLVTTQAECTCDVSPHSAAFFSTSMMTPQNLADSTPICDRRRLLTKNSTCLEYDKLLFLALQNL